MPIRESAAGVKLSETWYKLEYDRSVMIDGANRAQDRKVALHICDPMLWAECTFVYSRFLINTMSIERKAGGVMYCMIWKNLYNVFLLA
jgi:hypothetical protein